MSLRNIFTPLISMVAGGTQMETLSITFGVGEHAAKLAYGSFLPVRDRYQSHPLSLLYFRTRQIKRSACLQVEEDKL